MPAIPGNPPSMAVAQQVGKSSSCVLTTGVYEEWIGAYPGATIVREIRKNKRGQHYLAIWSPTFDRILEAHPDATPLELKKLIFVEIAKEKAAREVARQERRRQKEQEAQIPTPAPQAAGQ